MDQILAALLPAMPTGSTPQDAERIIAILRPLLERGVDVDDLVGTSEIAEILGISKQSIANYASGRARKGTGFPAPLRVLAATPVYSRKAVEQWWANVNRSVDNGAHASP